MRRAIASDFQYETHADAMAMPAATTTPKAPKSSR
jgi:hypothetical protein